MDLLGIRWFCRGRAGALALGAALLLLILVGCSETTTDAANSDVGNTQESTRQTNVAKTTNSSADAAPNDQDESEKGGDDQARQDSSGNSPDRDSQPQPTPEPEQAGDSGGQGSRQAAGSGQRQSGNSSYPGAAGLASRGKVITVTRVVDGDTIEVSPTVNGIQDVRLIGMDTPETYGGTEPLGSRASAFTTDVLSGRRVALELGQERVDQYGRALAYVWTSEGKMFNSRLLRKGLAQVATFPPNTKYVDRFEAIQADARAADLGIWGLSQAKQCELADRGNGIGEGSSGCTGAGKQPAPAPNPSPAPQPSGPQSGAANRGSGSAPPVSEDDCPQSHPIKGNESSGIYHPPSGGSYSVTNPEVCFASPAAAEAAGYRAARN